VKYVDQRILSDPERGDGHDANGVPGDCLRACVASITGFEYEDVPHFATYEGSDWWDAMRRWARAHGNDFACLRVVNGSVRESFERYDGQPVIASGPSPRGPFLHSVVTDVDLNLLHDPHPSRAGLAEVEDVIAYVAPYDPTPAPPTVPAGAWEGVIAP
jgi:hypothetical protein